jgi:ferredoxin
VLEGADCFEAPDVPEQDLLDVLGGGKGASRLACQAHVRPGPGMIRLKAHLGLVR